MLRRFVLAVALAGIAFFAFGCGPYLDTPMHAATNDVTTPSPGKALVIFVRPSPDLLWNLDVAIAEESGAYVAAVGTNEHVAVSVEPGRHVFFVFRGAATHGENTPTLVSIVEAAPSKVYVVQVNLGIESGTEKYGFGAQAGALVTPVRSHDDAYRMVHETKPYEVDSVAAHDYLTNGSAGQKDFWAAGLASGKDALAKATHEQLEQVTLHPDEGFEP